MIIKDKISSILRYKNEIDTYRSKMAKEDKKPSFVDCLWSYIRYGCVLNHYLYGKFYNLPYSERKKAFTYRNWCRILPEANNSSEIHFLKNKADFNTLFSDFIHRDWLSCKDLNLDKFTTFIKEHKEIVIKPIDGLEGDGISLRTFKNDEEIREAYDRLKGRGYLIEEKIIQHPDMVFGNKSVNTIRVYTIYNNVKDEVGILKTVVRAGIGDSIVDNSHSGGCAYEIDKKTGKIVSHSYCANGLETEIHPKTNIRMIGRMIPFWPEVLKLCQEAALRVKDCRFIGWDVAITENGPLLIEGNHTPDLDMVEFVGSHGYLPTIKKMLNI